MVVFYNYSAFRKCIGWWGFLSKRQRKSAISKHCQSTYHDTLNRSSVKENLSTCSFGSAILHQLFLPYVNKLTSFAFTGYTVFILIFFLLFCVALQCVHRDLACRNVLLGKGNIPMVSDFGLARDIYESGMYETTSGVSLIFDEVFCSSHVQYTRTVTIR